MLDVPLGHAMHEESEVLSVVGLYVIGGHGVVAFAPVGQYEPWGQG